MFVWKEDMKVSITNCFIGLLIIMHILKLVFPYIFPHINLTWLLGMNGKRVVIGAEYWRLFTATLVHADIFHLLMNSYFIFIVGNGVEVMLGKGRYIALLLFTMLSSSVAVLLQDMMSNSNGITIGASGFGYGLIGLIVGFALVYPKRYYGRLAKSLMFNVVGYSLVLMFLLPMNISLIGHLGGFIGGLIMAGILTTFFVKDTW